MPKYKAINFKDTGKSSGNVYLSEIQGAIGVTVKKEFSCLQLKMWTPNVQRHGRGLGLIGALRVVAQKRFSGPVAACRSCGFRVNTGACSGSQAKL